MRASALVALSSVVGKSIPLVLGSGSSSRALILRELDLAFEVFKPDIDEKAIRFDDPKELVLALGKAKAAELQFGKHAEEMKERGALILTGDQVVVCDGKILEKPESEAEARNFISSYADHPPSTVGSCVVTDAVSGRQWSAVDVATVHFTPIPGSTVDELIAEGEVFYCAGGLMVEHPKVEPHVERMDGSIDSVMGFCKETIVRLLEQAVAAREEDAAAN